MTIGVLTMAWDLKLPQGGQQTVVFALKQADGIKAYPVAGRTFEYVIRANPKDTGAPLTSITTAQTDQGQLVVEEAFANVVMTMLKGATADLDPGTYYHAFWMDPGQSTQFCWFAGKLIVDPASQP